MSSISNIINTGLNSLGLGLGASASTAGDPVLEGVPLAQDPAYLAYLRSAGLVENAAINNYNQKTSAYQAALQGSLQQMQQQAPIQQRNLAGSYEARGVDRSGEALRGASELAAQQQAQQNAAIQSTASNIGNESSALAQAIAQSKQNAAQAGLDAANRLAAGQAQGNY